MNIRCFRLDLGVFGTFLFLFVPVATVEAGTARELCSPDGKIAITVYTNAPLSFIHNSHPPTKRIFPTGTRFAQGLKAELICQNSMEPNHVRWNRRRTAGD